LYPNESHHLSHGHEKRFPRPRPGRSPLGVRGSLCRGECEVWCWPRKSPWHSDSESRSPAPRRAGSALAGKQNPCKPPGSTLCSTPRPPPSSGGRRRTEGCPGRRRTSRTSKGALADSA
uniref:Uncharacterized protein n=1 Tax=Oryctolagus cuniculus TaxID=9986 RepID=A0A5F9D3F0_RABIT